MACGEVGPGGEVAAIEGCCPGGEGRGEQGCVVESDTARNGGVVGEEGIGMMLGLVVGKEDWAGVGFDAGEIDGPEIGCGGSGAGEDGGSVEGDVDGGWMEGGSAAMVAEEADG